MLISCDNKGCMQQTSALLNTKTLEVICGSCGKAIKSISEPMKRTLKSFGQILRTNEKKAFMMACKNCNANREVILNEKNETICRVCKDGIKVHAAMKQAIMEVGSKLSSLDAGGEEEEDEAAVKKVRGKKNKQ